MPSVYRQVPNRRQATALVSWPSRARQRALWQVPAVGPFPGGRGAYAIRALPDLCRGINRARFIGRKVAPPKQNPVGGIGSSGGVLTLGTRKGTKLPSPSQNHARTLPTSCRLDPRLWNLKCQATANANVCKRTRPTETGLPGWGGETRTRISVREPCI